MKAKEFLKGRINLMALSPDEKDAIFEVMEEYAEYQKKEWQRQAIIGFINWYDEQESRPKSPIVSSDINKYLTQEK